MKPISFLNRSLLSAFLVGLAPPTWSDIQPTASTPGVSIDRPSTDVTQITAPDNAIIDYARFDIAAHHTVSFIQPSASSRVLNRIHSNMPSQIDGKLNANGIVYLVNPAGVTFGADAVVDAAGIFAAAGHLSDSDFLAGVNQFTSITGNVAQHGTIRADTLAAFIGRHVHNTGTIAVPDGTAILASGDRVLIGNPLGGVMLQVDATPNLSPGSITNDGRIDANQLSLVSGDLFSLAMTPQPQTSATSTGGFRPNVTIADIDTDGDGDIDNDDVNTAFANFTGPLPQGTGGKTQQQGDTDRDGDVDNTDLGTLFIFFTGPLTPPSNPTENPAGEFDLSQSDLVEPLPGLSEEVNFTEADLGILRDQLGIVPRQPLPAERLEKAQARALYDDLRARGNVSTSPDGSMIIANTRLDADVVRQVLTVYRERLAAEGVTPAERSAQIRDAVNQAYANYTTYVQQGKSFDALAFGSFVQQNNPALFESLSALNELNRLTARMGLNELEQLNSERTIIDRSRPEAMPFEQMKATLQAAGSLSPSPTEPTDGATDA